jgi:hypothetical protein
MGDNSVLLQAASLPRALNIINWLTWFVAVVTLNIVLLNFIVAEACACYTEVSDSLESVIWREKANMIVEAERMTRT